MMRTLTIFITAALFLFVASTTPAFAQAKKPVAPKPGEVYKPTPADADAVNLIPNGDFEAGEITPEGWQSIDNLSAFWVEDSDPAHGKVLKFDTDILQTQAYPWWKEIAGGASPKNAPARLPTVEPKYDTLAGLDGTWYWSDPVPVDRGKAYWLTLDVKGPAMLLWLVGYPEKPTTRWGADAAAFQGYLQKEAGEFKNERGRKGVIHTYVWKGQMTCGGSDEWKTYSRREKPFRPTKERPSVRWVRVMLYPFWPPANYYVDNVKLVEVDPAYDAAQLAKEETERDARLRANKAKRDAEESADSGKKPGEAKPETTKPDEEK